jgi:hypothetical protein
MARDVRHKRIKEKRNFKHKKGERLKDIYKNVGMWEIRHRRI